MATPSILITGASKGIGRALANRLSSAGQHVIGLARHADATFPGELTPQFASNLCQKVSRLSVNLR